MCVIAGCSIGGAPAVAYTVPGSGTGSFSAIGSITVTFTRPMDGSTITASSFLVESGSTPVAGTVSASGNTATFKPTGSLPYDSLLTATITTAAKDVSGNALAANYSWQFSTRQTFTGMTLHWTATFSPNPFTRSVTPVSLVNGGNIVSQTINPDGSITLNIASAPAYEDVGFYFFVGALQSFNSLSVTAASGSGPFSANLYLDCNNDGDFFTWSTSNVFSGLGGDLYLSGPNSVGNTLTINSTTVFTETSPPYTPYTLSQVKAGSLAGVSGTTVIGIWLGCSLSSGSQTTTITGIQQQ